MPISSKPRDSSKEKLEGLPQQLRETLEKIMRSFETDYESWSSKHKIGESSSRNSSSWDGNLAISEDSSVTSNAEVVENSESSSSSNGGRKGRPKKANCVETTSEVLRTTLTVIKNSFEKDYQSRLPEKEIGGSSSGNSSSRHGINLAISKGRPKANCVETTSKLPPGQTIHGFDNELIFLKNFLLKKKESKDFKSLAVVGKYGVGKTTLCRFVFNDEDVKQAYVPRLWISMYSKEDNKDDPKIAIVKRLLKSLGVEEEMLNYIEKEVEEEKRNKEEKGETVIDKKLSTLLSTLNFILTGKKYLIIFDDVWEDNKWDQKLDDNVAENQEIMKTHLSSGFPKGSGGRVIVTSRDEKLGKKLVGEEDKLQRLYPRLDLESIWDIYKDAYEEDKGKIELKPRYPGRYKQALMDKCCGIPLAAKMLAKIEPVKMDEQGGDLEKKKEILNSEEVTKENLEKKKEIVNSDEGIEENVEKKQL